MRVAFHAINGVGLGHLVRVTAVAEEVRALVRELGGNPTDEPP